MKKFFGSRDNKLKIKAKIITNALNRHPQKSHFHFSRSLFYSLSLSLSPAHVITITFFYPHSKCFHFPHFSQKKKSTHIFSLSFACSLSLSLSFSHSQYFFFLIFFLCVNIFNLMRHKWEEKVRYIFFSFFFSQSFHNKHLSIDARNELRLMKIDFCRRDQTKTFPLQAQWAVERRRKSIFNRSLSI